MPGGANTHTWVGGAGGSADARGEEEVEAGKDRPVLGGAVPVVLPPIEQAASTSKEPILLADA